MKDIVGGDCELMAMIKADAYGHGAVETAKALLNEDCNRFGVGEIREAVLLRDAGIKAEIFIMLGFEPELTPLIFDYNLTPVVFDIQTIKDIANEAELRGVEIGCHVKVDTGMNRLGFSVDQVKDVVELLGELNGVQFKGLLSHFPEADVTGSASSLEAIDKFSKLSNELRTNYNITCHLANSGGVLNFPEALFDMGRAGISLYGYHPAGNSAKQPHGDRTLIPAMSCKTKVIQLKRVEAGAGISYGHTYRPNQEETLAVLPIGYEDGFSRSLSNKGEVLIRGKRAPVRGRICMNLCMVDISHIEDVKVGDEVVLLGSQGEECITADEIAEKAGTISYEILCMFGHSNNKIYID